MKKISTIIVVLALLVASTASAHVTVRPNQAGVGSFQTFNVSVPSEKDAATTGLRLIIPEGFGHVSPTVKPGWTINLVTGASSSGEEEVVKEIVWTRGSIPGHFRDDFSFSAQVPTTESTIFWKAYQTYSDGSVVAWELTPDQEQPKNEEGSPDFSQKGPASQTKIINDLAAAPQQPAEAETQKDIDALFLSMIAVVISIMAVYLARRRTTPPAQ
ncbi:MAG TPA: YcnI family protein [Candidatus Binatia bacterium]|nr:YcnI family protein [Candidatus Binatia bacterium]